MEKSEHISKWEKSGSDLTLIEKIELMKTTLEEELASMEEGAGVTHYRVVHQSGQIDGLNRVLAFLKKEVELRGIPPGDIPFAHI